MVAALQTDTWSLQVDGKIRRTSLSFSEGKVYERETVVGSCTLGQTADESGD